ncbi:hypothetical protein [Nostoc parmelioides]|uniref:hypothetical protein n=1 Tax=Nostoc parmelioides TaxID=1521621 RepID=UPI0016872106|nr:hypothetical protein [Nostoc parmelioides]
MQQDRKPSLHESQEKSVQPSQQEVQEVLQQAVEGDSLYPTVPVKWGDSAYSQAVLGECAGGDRLSQRGVTDLERD